MSANADLALDARQATRALTGEPVRAQHDGIDALHENWHILVRRARYIARGLVDADDLLAGAVAATWEKWLKGTGPTDNALAYVTQAMRNRLLDELKSPRHAVLPIDDLTVDLTYDDDRSRVDQHREYADIQAAVRRLPVDQRRVLMDVVVNGRKPRDLEAEYRQPAPAISTVAYRAKKALRSELFLHMIRSECDSNECARAQTRVARDLWKSASLGESCPQVSQLWQCPRCAKGLHRYLDISQRVAA